MNHKFLITLTGPSGSGKSELLNKLCATGKFARLISTTTRPMRAGEVADVDYRFITEAMFLNFEKKDQFVQTVNFQGKYYGTLKIDAEDMLEKGVTPIAIVEPSGIPHFAKYCEEQGYTHFSVFINADFQILLQRYLSRMAPADLIDADKRKYHAKRIAGIRDEHDKWKDTWQFNNVFNNSKDDINEIKDIADVIDMDIMYNNKIGSNG